MGFFLKFVFSFKGNLYAASTTFLYYFQFKWNNKIVLSAKKIYFV